MSDMFTFRDSLEPEGSFGLPAKRGGGADEQHPAELTNYKVQATDGSIGRVLDASYGHGDSYIIVSTGGSLLAKHVMLPAGVVERVDHDHKTIHVNRSKAQIKEAPEFDEERIRDAAYRGELSDHYIR